MTQTTDIHEVRPRLRFLLSDAAKEEGKKMANLFSTYSARKDPGRMSSQFRHIIESIQSGRFPNIAQADEAMKGTLTASLQVIVDGRRLPDWLMWRQTWANELANGRPQSMAAAAHYMIDFKDKLEELLDTNGQQFDMNEDEGAAAPRVAERVLCDVADPIVRERLRKQMLDGASLAVFREYCPEVVPLILYGRNMSEEDKAWHARMDDHRRLKEYAKNMISEIERVTREKFERAWKTKAELHASLRAHFKDAGFEEELSLRGLHLGAY